MADVVSFLFETLKMKCKLLLGPFGRVELKATMESTLAI